LALRAAVVPGVRIKFTGWCAIPTCRYRPRSLRIANASIAWKAPGRRMLTLRRLVARGGEQPYSGAVRACAAWLLVLAMACGPPRSVVTARTSFTLADGTARVPVIAWGTQEIGMGDVVEVRGAFRSQLRVGVDMVPDAVEAKFVRVVRHAGQPPGTPVSPP
jgi:hypothetical protein